MKVLFSTNNYPILLDNDDFKHVSKFSWWAQTRAGRINRVFRSTRVDGKQKSIPISFEILGKKEGLVIDHINRCALDNRKENLRFCTTSQNMQNRSYPIKMKSSKFIGVRKRRGRWQASICHNKKHKDLGSFNTQKQAALAYDAEALSIYGPYARVNFPFKFGPDGDGRTK